MIKIPSRGIGAPDYYLSFIKFPIPSYIEPVQYPYIFSIDLTYAPADTDIEFTITNDTNDVIYIKDILFDLTNYNLFRVLIEHRDENGELVDVVLDEYEYQKIDYYSEGGIKLNPKEYLRVVLRVYGNDAYFTATFSGLSSSELIYT